MSIQRLLVRLRAMEDDPERRSSDRDQDIISGITEHLQKLLNTRQGSALIAPDYGIPDFTELLHSYPESVRDMERALKSAISKYEPRLKGVRVRFIPDEDDPLNLRFEIMARLANLRDAPSVFFESIVDADGKVSIRR